eukprot:1136764-Pelagomonas_calceolata.AAC.15
MPHPGQNWCPTWCCCMTDHHSQAGNAGVRDGADAQQITVRKLMSLIILPLLFHAGNAGVQDGAVAQQITASLVSKMMLLHNRSPQRWCPRWCCCTTDHRAQADVPIDLTLVVSCRLRWCPRWCCRTTDHRVQAD